MEESAAGAARVIHGGQARPGSVLMLYGMGGADRYATALKHVATGGLLVTWDLGYWGRHGPHSLRNMRVSINGMHPPAFVLCGPVPPVDRWKASGLGCAQRGGNPGGPVVLVGNGPKSNVIGAMGWAAAKSAEIRQKMPGARIVYRPKPKRPHDLGVSFDEIDEGPIDFLLARSSLVVCRHSNVAVDACRLAVPVVCDDGAAAAIYPHRLEDAALQPSYGLRAEFLRRLAWWQWSPDEARKGEVWPWLNGILDEVRLAVPA